MGIISFDISLYILMFLSRSCNFGLFYFCLFLLQDTRAVRIFDRRVSSYSSDVYLFFSGFCFDWLWIGLPLLELIFQFDFCYISRHLSTSYSGCFFMMDWDSLFFFGKQMIIYIYGGHLLPSFIDSTFLFCYSNVICKHFVRNLGYVW